MHVWGCIYDEYVSVQLCKCMCIPVCGCVYMCIYVYVCLQVFVVCSVITDSFVRSEPCNRRPDPDLCSLWTWYTADSKTDPWDDPEIRTGSCSEDQTAIRIQNRVISCECLLLCYFLIYCSQ